MHSTLRCIIASLGMITVFSISAWAQDTLEMGEVKYREVGPSRGGRVTTVAGAAKTPNVFYMGSTGGGVWKTSDYGISWKNISDGYFGSPSTGAIAVWQENPEVLYIGTGSDGLRSNVIAGDGMYKSTDAGKTWTHIGLEKTGHIGAVEIHPSDSNTVFVAAIGNGFAPNAERGIYRTQDGGATWEQVLFISEKTGFADLVFHPTNPEVIYAGAWRAERKPWTIISGDEEENGIYKTTDGGDTWTKITEGLPAFCGKIDLAVSPAEPDVVVALIEAPEKNGGLYRSDDAGANWEQVTDEPDLLIRPFYFLNVDLDPTNADVVYVNTLRFHKSTDGGKEWKMISTPHGDNHAMWINPDNPDLFVQGNDGGANVTLNGGKSWSHQFNQPTAELYQVEVDNQYPYRLYAGQQDNYTAIAVPSLPPRSMQAGHVAYIEDVGGCETGPAVPNPVDPNIVYANCKGRFSVFNRATGQEQAYDVGAAFMYGHNPKDLKFRFQRVSPIHVSPHNPEVIYHTSQYVHMTQDGGKTWATISPDLTAFEEDKQVISGGPITRDITGEEFYSTIYAIRESSVKAGVIWVGANDGPVHVTQDGGRNWTNVTPPDLAGGGRVDAVEPSPHNAAKAYISVLRYQLGDWMPYVYMTENYGESWTLLTDGENGIPEGFPTRVIREDPTEEGVLVAGTEYGMFISFDEGASWASMQGNLPVSPISDVKFHRGDLVLSTMGRGFWVLDQFKALKVGRKRSGGPAGSKASLLVPRNQIRWEYSARGSRQISDYPRYPRPGVYFDYYVHKEFSDPLEIHIISMSTRDTVRSFTVMPTTEGDEEEPEPDMATGRVAISPSGNLSQEVGRHRFLWDMRHAGGWHEDAAYRFGAGGPLVAPGDYMVVLSTGAMEGISQRLTLELDPRVEQSGITQADLEAQEAFALAVRDFRSEVDAYVYGLEEELKDLDAKERLKRREANRKAALEEQLSMLVNEEGAYPQQMYQSQVRYLYGVVVSGAKRPGKDAYDRFEELKAEWENILDD